MKHLLEKFQSLLKVKRSGNNVNPDFMSKNSVNAPNIRQLYPEDNYFFPRPKDCLFLKGGEYFLDQDPLVSLDSDYLLLRMMAAEKEKPFPERISLN